MDMRSKETGELSVVSAKRVFNALKVVRDRNAQLKTLFLIYSPYCYAPTTLFPQGKIQT